MCKCRDWSKVEISSLRNPSEARTRPAFGREDDEDFLIGLPHTDAFLYGVLGPVTMRQDATPIISHSMTYSV